MSLLENPDTDLLPQSNDKYKHSMIIGTGSKVDSTYTKENKEGSVTSSNPNNISSDIPGLKDRNTASRTKENKSSIPRHLKKTISSGSINPVSASKVVLRRWKSLVQNEETVTKRHSSPSVYERTTEEKITFRPVSSILASTPWEKYFKGNAGKLGKESVKKVEDKQKNKENYEVNGAKFAKTNSCSAEKFRDSKEFSTGDAVGKTNVILNSNQIKPSRYYVDVVGKSRTIPDNRAHENCQKICVNNGPSSKQVNGGVDLEEKANYLLNGGTATPQVQDYSNNLTTTKSYQEEEQKVERSNDKDFSVDSQPLEEMSLSTGSYNYKSKYSTDFSSNEPSYRRGNNLSSYSRRLGTTVDRSYPSTRGTDLTYTTAFKINRAENIEKSGQETVAEVEAFIAAYKSRKERSFEYGDSRYQSYISSRGERKTSLDRTPLPYQSHATRSYSSSYTPTYVSNSVHASSTTGISKQRPSYFQGGERDFTSRPSHYLTKTDRSKSFDVENVTYPSFKRTGSGGRYSRRTTASGNSSSGSSTSSSRGYTPIEKELIDSPFSPGLPESNDKKTSSIFSSDALTPSEKAFFAGSKVARFSETSSSTSYRKSSLDYESSKPLRYRKSSLDYSIDTETQKKEISSIRPLSLIDHPKSNSASRTDVLKRRSAILSSENETTSRSRIMGGILSRFFTEDETSKSEAPVLPVCTESSENIEDKSTADSLTTVNRESTEESKISSKEEALKDLPISGKNLSHSQQDGDSRNVIQSSPLHVTSQDCNQTPSKNRQLVRVKSTFVEEGESKTMGKEKSSQKVKGKSFDGAERQVSKESKEHEQTPSHRERRSSWIGRSLRKISSASKSTATGEEPHEKTEKPKRERRRSLLWRLGRESKTSETSEIVDEKVASKSEEATLKEIKVSEKKEKSDEKKEDRGFASYLRRSSKRKKSQVSEKEILEARQEVDGKSREDKESPVVKELNEPEVKAAERQGSLSDIIVHAKDEATKPSLTNLDCSEPRAPLAQSEDSDDEMASVSARRTRFTEVLRQKEEAARDAAKESVSQKTISPSKTTKDTTKIDPITKKATPKQASSYLSSKFLKSKNLFETSSEKPNDLSKKDEASKTGTRRWTQEAKPSSGIERSKEKETNVDTKNKETNRYKPKLNEKKTLFQRSRTVDLNEKTKSSEVGRVPLKERNKASVSECSKKQVTTGKTSKAPVRRLVSDSADKLKATERKIANEQKIFDRDNDVEKVIAKSSEEGIIKDNEEDKVIARRRKWTKNLDRDDAESISLETALKDKDEVHRGKSDAPGGELGEPEQAETSTGRGSSMSKDDFLEHVVAEDSDQTESRRLPLRMRIDLSNERKDEMSLKGECASAENEVSIERTESRRQSKEKNGGRTLETETKPDWKSEESSKGNGSEIDDITPISEAPSQSSNELFPESVVNEEIEKNGESTNALKVNEDNEGKDIASDRAGSRRRRERRAHRIKQVDPQEIEKVKEQIRRESNARSEDVAQLAGSASVDIEDAERIESGAQNGRKLGEVDDVKFNDNEKPRLPDDSVSETLPPKIPEALAANFKQKEPDRIDNIVAIKLEEKLTEADTGDESNESSGGSSGTKITTRSVIKDKIRQKKFDKKLRKDRTMSLPLGVEIVISPAITAKKEHDVVENGTKSPVVRTKPPMIPKIQRSQEADDVVSLKRKQKRPMRSRPKTLTQGIDPSLLLSDIKAKEEAVVVEERLSINQLKLKLLQSESGSRTPRTPEVQRKNKRRSGKRYKTITEGIAPGLLEAAHQIAAGEHDPNKLGVDQMNKLNVALSVSTENLKRRSFIVSEVNSRVGSIGASLATSMEDLSMKENGNDDRDDKSSESIVEESIRKLKKLPMVVDSDEEDPMPSVSSLRDRFMQAVEDSYKPIKSKVSMRKKGVHRERPFTISGIDDLTFKQLQSDIRERHEAEREASQNFGNVEVRIELDTNKRIDELEEDKLEQMFESEGLTADQVAKELGINPSLAQGSPLRTRKPFLGTTAEETAGELLETIEEKGEKHEKEEKQSKPLVDLRQQFMNAMNEFKSGSFDKGIDTKEEIKDEGEIANVDDEPKSDLDFISQNVTQLQAITDRRHLKPQRKQRSKANPVKTLQARDDLITEVGSNKNTENVTKDAQKPQEKSLGMKLWRKVALASEAKAALQSTEDFSKVKLKRVKVPGVSVNGEPAETAGVVESSITNLLLKIKGRRHVQINVVDFSTNSLTSDDSFVVVTPRDLLCWHGRNANVIEKAKASEIASRINQKKEMGCKAFDVAYFEQEGQNESRVFRVLGSDGAVDVKDETDDDEEYERNMMSTSMVYSLQDSDPPELVPVYDMCQRSPSKEILRTDETYVFDFLSEVYVWIGRQTMSGVRKKIMKLAREKFEQGYYKPPSPTTPLHHGKSRKISLTTTELPLRKQSINRKLSVHKFMQDKENLAPRPAHSIFLSMFEGAEWVIFKEKFCDWPDESRIIRMKGGPQTVGELVKKVNVSDVKPVDPQTMLKPKIEPLLPIFEGTEIDRGNGKPKGPEGYHIITRCVQVWHVTERSRTLLPSSSNGQFHSGEGYVIRWEFSIVASRVMKMLKDIEEAKATGRHRCAYFFWLGNDCSITEQGATAVMTVDLDEERGPHVRVIQGKEPPCFLNLFDGGMIIHAGKRKSKTERAAFSDQSVVRLYCIRSENPNEACLLQVPVSATSLRSRSSFVLVLCHQAEIFLWHGCKSTDAIKSTAIQAAHRLIENHPEEGALSEKEEIFLTEIEEGHEPEVFWVALGGEDEYGSLLTDLNSKWDFAPRCFHLTSTTGQFVANEIINPSISPKETCPFPFLQDDLYDAYQPAIFIIDAIHEVYLWLGWWPEDEESENSDAQRMRWDVDKKKAMESVVLYAKEQGRSMSHCYVVDAGLEPEQFINLFPYWIVQEDITDIQIEDGREDSGKLKLISKKLEGFTREYFSIDELTERPLPEGVNPSKLESYLSDEDFYTVFRMNRNEFKKIPGWRQDNLKKRVGLY